jgi:hypothetical protein
MDNIDLDNNEIIIKPSKCKIGQLLLHSKPDINNYEMKEIEGFDETLLEGKIKDIQNQEQAQEYFIILEQLGYNATIDYNNNNYIVYYTKKQIKETGIIKKEILHDNYDGYVYDIETEFGVFHGGIGRLILKNTDSIFCKFPLKDEEGELIFGKSSLPVAIKVGKSVEKNIASIMPHPQKLNYEKSLYPFILLSKKRYVGNLYETDVNSYKQKSMGIVLKRRDNAHIVKKVYGGVIDFERYKSGNHWKSVKSDLNDVEVELYFLHRDEESKLQNSNLRDFWIDFFEGQGAKVTRFLPIEG